MQRTLITSTMFFAILFSAAAWGQDGEAPVADLARGAIDPLDVGGQRARFLRAAGVDSELNRAEFDADHAKKDGFVRSFDKWENLVRFDKDGNGTVDWLEATSYREELRDRLLAEYDADDNGRLTGDERTATNEALAAGRLPRLLSSPVAAAAPVGARNERRRDGFEGSGFRDEQFQQIRAQLLQKYDEDGDGELNREERRASREEAGRMYREAFTRQWDTNGDGDVDEAERRVIGEQFMIRRFDRDGDGQLNEAEREAMEQARQEFARRAEEGRQRFLQEFDTDGDGQISEAEGAAARETFRQRAEEQRRQFMQRFDSDSDGEISDDERRTGFETLRREFTERFDTDGDGELNAAERGRAVEEGGFGLFGGDGFGGRGRFGDRDRRRRLQ